MRSRLRAHVWVLALLAGVLISLSAAAGAQAAAELPSVEKLVATNCKVATCGEEEVEKGPFGEPFFEPKAEISEAEAEAEGFTEAGGRVPYGVTDFKVFTIPGGKYSTDSVVPASIVTHIRTDVAPGLATDPFAVERCTLAEFGEETLPGTGFFTAPGPECAESEIGENDATVYAGNPGEGGAGDLPLSGEVYDLIPGAEERMANGAKLASDYGVALELPIPVTKGLLTKGFAEDPLPESEFHGATKPEREAEKAATEKALEEKQWYAHTLIKGNVEWGKEARGTDQGDFHDYFEIEVSPALPLIRSRLVFDGTTGEGDFVTNATSCPGHNTTTLQYTDLSGTTVGKTFTTPIGLEGCESLKFNPKFALEQSNTLSDQPDELTAEASEEHKPKETDVSQVKSASFTLPEGMTLDPSAAHGLEACTESQAHQEETVFGAPFGVECPVGSKIGTVSLNVPTLPDGSLTGNVYLGGPNSGPIKGPPYKIYVVANSVQYGVSVRLLGEVVPNEVTGQVTTFFRNPPEQPFTSFTLHFDRGVLTSVANPLVCGTPQGSTSFTPTSAPATQKNESFGVSVTGCAASLPFALGQTAEGEIATGGGHTSYNYGLSRPEGDQYLQEVKTVLPEGLVGEIPDVTLCQEAAANAGTCGAASKIGTVSVASGSGSSPYVFNGSVYMTGPYNGAPFGLSIVVPAIAGPFNLGNVVSRATININPITTQVTAVSKLPTIVGGIPIRLRSLNVNVNRQGFLLNPTNCTAALRTESTLTSTTGTVQQGLSSPFPLEGCSALAFKPTFTASTSGKHSKANGASLVTTLAQLPGQANVKSVLVTLPKALPSRLTTLQKACLAKVFEANPYNCTKESPGSEVGTATAVTPTLPGVMKGPAYLVSHGGEAFPSLELVLESNGVRVIVEGKTNIKNGITTTNFESTPDVPVSSITVNLPVGPHSALTTERLNTNLCTAKLVEATKIVGQNGKEFKQNTVIAPTGCGVQIVGHKIVGNTAYLTIKTFAAGRISGSGSGLKTVYRTLAGASNATTLKVPLGPKGLGRRRPFSVKIRVGFVPKKKGAHSSASVKVKFRR
jgi:hypothetical protein